MKPTEKPISMGKTFYITTPIYYPNGIPHVGTAYTTIAADVLARWRRLTDGRAFLLTGTDEHGQKVEQAAVAKNVGVETYVNQIADIFKQAWKRLYIQYDDFIRTTETRHTKAAARIFTALKEKGDIYKGDYEGWYCVSCETFWPETQLVDKKCPNPECQRPVEWLKEEEYFFKLSAYQQKLQAHYESNPQFIQPKTRYNEVASFVSMGLQDVCVSRKGLKWGIPIPGDPGSSIYVWIDALSNYLSAIEYEANSEKFRSLWPADVHLVGKDILRFHAVIWPALLMALELPLPRKIFANGWLTMGGSKISKSRGEHRNLMELLDEYGADPIRYFLMREAAFGLDMDFSEDGIVRRLNTDLANDFGNLAQRALSMIHRYFEGKIPQPQESSDADAALRLAANELPAKISAALENLAFREALDVIFECVGLGNRYVDESSPWTLKKEGREDRLATVLYHLAEVLRILAIALSPFLPKSAALLWTQLALPGDVTRQNASAFAWGGLKPGTEIPKPVPLFQKLEL